MVFVAIVDSPRGPIRTGLIISLNEVTEYVWDGVETQHSVVVPATGGRRNTGRVGRGFILLRGLVSCDVWGPRVVERVRLSHLGGVSTLLVSSIERLTNCKGSDIMPSSGISPRSE
jgi:hypothetical protein